MVKQNKKGGGEGTWDKPLGTHEKKHQQKNEKKKTEDNVAKNKHE